MLSPVGTRSKHFVIYSSSARISAILIFYACLVWTLQTTQACQHQEHTSCEVSQLITDSTTERTAPKRTGNMQLYTNIVSQITFLQHSNFILNSLYPILNFLVKLSLFVQFAWFLMVIFARISWSVFVFVETKTPAPTDKQISYLFWAKTNAFLLEDIINMFIWLFRIFFF